MKRNVIPKGTLNRALVGITILVSVPAFVVMFKNGDYWEASFVASLGIATLILAYISEEQVESSTSANEYSVVIERISMIGAQLSDLNGFLEKERVRVADIEATVSKLNDEKTKLEPVVSTQRETVEAILAAHSERTARQAWKERLLGFALGVVASLIASVVYGYFNR